MAEIYQGKFKGLIELLKESWQIFSLKAKTLLAITAIPIGLGLITNILASFNLTSFWIIWFFLFLISLFFQFLAIPSLLFVLKENLSFKEAYQKGLRFFLSYLWLSFLVTVIVIGGFLLLIIPGIIFSIWFSLAVVVLILEEKRGMSALFRSKQLVAGRWWGVFWRLLVFNLIFGTIFLIFHFLLSNIFSVQIAAKFNYFFQLFLLPFGLIYRLSIYKNLKEIKEIPLSETPPKSRKIKYGIIALLGLLIFLPIITLAILNIAFGRDEAPPEDSDLRLSAIEIPREKNAFYDFEKATEKIYWPREKSDLILKIIEEKQWDEDLVEDILEKNREAFSYFEEALSYPTFQLPELQNPEEYSINMPLRPMADWKTLGRLVSLQSLYFFKKGKEKEAFDEALKLIKIGQLIENSPRPNLIQYLTGIAITETGLARMRSLIPKTKLPQKELIFYQEKLKDFEDKKEALTVILKGEYMFFSNFIDWTKNVGEKNNLFDEEFLGAPFYLKLMGKFGYYYKPNQTKRLFAEHIRREINKKYDYQSRPLIPYSLSEKLFTENLIGKIIYEISAVSLSAVPSRERLEKFSINATRLLIALKSFKNENGKLPNNLAELKPKYISEIPKDPFDGNPIRYSLKKKIIYSVGRNGEDEGGSEGDRLNEMADPTFKIEF